MRPTEFDEAVQVNGGTRKRGSARRAVAMPADEQKLADFAAVETPPIQAGVWPVHAVAWLQPDLSAAAPQSSGLRPERRHRVPVPDFLPFSCSAATPRLPIEHKAEPLPRPTPRPVFQCDLVPLGWDPRAEVRR